MTSKTSNSVYQLRHMARKRAGLKPVTAAWHWLTQARLVELSLEAYKAASWACRSPEVLPAEFVDELGRQLHMRLAAAALEAGLEGCPDIYAKLRAELDAALPDLPKDWRPQYRLFAGPQAGEGSQEQGVTPGPL